VCVCLLPNRNRHARQEMDSPHNKTSGFNPDTMFTKEARRDVPPGSSQEFRSQIAQISQQPAGSLSQAGLLWCCVWKPRQSSQPLTERLRETQAALSITTGPARHTTRHTTAAQVQGAQQQASSSRSIKESNRRQATTQSRQQESRA